LPDGRMSKLLTAAEAASVTAWAPTGLQQGSHRERREAGESAVPWYNVRQSVRVISESHRLKARDPGHAINCLPADRVRGETPSPPMLGKESTARRLFAGAPGMGAGFCFREVSVRFNAAVLTISEREDLSGPLLAHSLESLGASVLARRVVPDEPELISAALKELADGGEIDLIITTGGTGAAPRDHTPEATLAIIDREMPGIAELLRWKGYESTPRAVLSRGVAGLRKQCLIINLAGSRGAVSDGVAILAPVLAHALQMAQGTDLEHESGRHERT
jgi:molybdopterin adenylyltransferase